jgi:D-glycero-D-manno-heptose 1,7-bisphosphate phosphatase
LRLTTIFLDRDGVLNRRAREGDYIKSPDELEMLDGAVEGVRLLNERGLLVVVVTNQRGIALGRMSALDLERVHAELRSQLAGGGARLDGIYHCPHDKGSCDCRKPLTGLFVHAQRDHSGIDFARSAVIGDSVTDMQAAERIGARGILVGGEELAGFEQAPSLLEAARLLVGAQDPPAARARASARPSGVPTSTTGSGSA